MFEKIAYLLGEPAAWFALLTWPKFSLSSYRIVSALKRQGIEPKTIIDVGANIGQFSIACARIFSGASIHAFEPQPECVAKLESNVRPVERVVIYAIALGAQSGEIEFNINSHNHSSSILPLGERHLQAFPGACEIGKVWVPVSTLDSEMANIPLESPVLLKLDVQGYEPQVLEGATKILESVDYVLLEASFQAMYQGEKTFMEIARIMEKFGFEFLRPISSLSDPRNGELLQMDALFCKCS